MSQYLDRDLAAAALQRASSAIEQLLVCNAMRTHLSVVIGRRNPNGSFQRIIVKNFGYAAVYEHDYQEIASKKAELSARTGLSSREVQLLHPELLQYGDTCFFGSVICGDIVVAASGVEAYFDEACAKIVLTIILALIEHKIVLLRNEGDTLG